jgi:colanic acid/amylovoran biosynthesis glycosyltransferase
MRLAVIVSEFPKTTETFILRDLVQFRQMGAELRLYYLAPYRTTETVHDFARPLLSCVHHEAMALSPRIAGAAFRSLGRRSGALGQAVGRMADGFRREPALLAKSLALVPKILALTEDMAAWGADHVHAEFAGHPATAAWIAHRLTGLPYSVSCRAHDIFTTQSLLDVKLAEASFVRTVSDYNKAFLLSHVPGLTPERIEVIHSSLDVAAIDPPPPRERGGSFDVLFVGGLRSHKGVDVLLRAMAGPKALPHWRLDLIGDGPERRALERLARELGLEGRARFHGSRPFEAIAQAYEAAHVVVAPSIVGPGGRTEGIPNVMIEALAYRRPAIASRVTGVPELILHGRTGLLVEPGDVDGLAEALLRVERNPDEADAMAAEGRRRVERHFDLRVNARRQLDAFVRHSRIAAVPREAVA